MTYFQICQENSEKRNRRFLRDTVSKRLQKICKNIFCPFWNIKKIKKIINSQERTPSGHKTPGQARPGEWCPPWVPSGLHFSSVFLFSKIKKIFIYPPNLLTSVSQRNLLFFFSSCFSNRSENSHPKTRRVRAMLLIISQTLRFMGMWSTIAGLRRKKKTMILKGRRR